MGLSPAFIGKFAKHYYGCARSTVYRYVSDNKRWYDQKTREQLLTDIQTMLCKGYTSGEIARELDEDLKRINKLIVDNNISLYKCYE